MRSLATVGLCLLGASPAAAETFTSVDVATRSLQSSCLDWKIAGACLWLHCKFGRCRVITTPRIRHHLPDVVFAAYDQTGASPWREARAVLKHGAFLQGGSFPTTEVSGGHNLRFKEVDAIGHPFPWRQNVFDVPYLCRSQAKPLFPYFVSLLDHLEWRGGLESARVESITPGLREIGNWPLNSWGALFPRTGFVQQAEDAKAAAVAVQRAADIVLQSGQARVYVPFGYDGHRQVTHGDPRAADRPACEQSGGVWHSAEPASAVACDPAEPLAECAAYQQPSAPAAPGRCGQQAQVAWLPSINERNARWQMISPITQSRCETFGSPSNWSIDKTSEDGSYAWNLWRPYECCVPGKGKFIGTKTF